MSIVEYGLKEAEMEENGKTKWVNTELKGSLIQKFGLVKAYYAIGSNADVVRFLIAQAAREIAAAQVRLLAVDGRGT